MNISVINRASIDNPYLTKIYAHHEYFHRVVDIFDESDSNFRPCDDLLSVAGQVLHVAIFIEYYLSGMFGKYQGFSPLSCREFGFIDMSWTYIADAKHLNLILDSDRWPKAFKAATSITLAMELFDEATEKALELVKTMSPEDFATARLPENPVFKPQRCKYADVLEVMNDHTAHHRGALVVYAHLLGKDPRMPYLDTEQAVKHSQQLQAQAI